MFNLKWAIVLGVAGMVLSLVIGLFSGIGFPQVFVRAGIMGAVFFALGCGLWLLINNFIPELLFPETNAESGGGETMGQFDSPGSRVNITVEGPQNLPEIFKNLDHGDDVGNITDLVSGRFLPTMMSSPPKPAPAAAAPSSFASELGIDQNPQDGYTENSSPDFSPASSSQSSAASKPPAGSAPASSSSSSASELPDMQEGGMGDLEGMAGFFSDTEEDDSDDTEEAALPERRPTGNKSQKLEGDFDPKDLAMGIRTVLSKEDK